MKISLIFASFIGVLLFAPFAELEAQKRQTCSVCGKEIRPGMSFLKTDDGRIFCSKACYEKTLPKCSVCGAILKGSYLKGADGKFYCSEKCLSLTFPVCAGCGKKSRDGVIINSEKGELFFCKECSSKPKCFCCGLPLKSTELSDGRYLCNECAKDAITETKEASELISEVRKIISEKLFLKTEHQIEYELVDQKTLDKISPQNQAGLELGLFRFIEETETTTLTTGREKKETVKVSKSYKIYMISDLSKRKFIEVAAHELAHDWMQEYYPKITDLKIKEGWAQYIAWKVNSLYKNDGLNKLIENNKDPIYGDGFRLIKLIADKSNSPMDTLHIFFKENNK